MKIFTIGQNFSLDYSVKIYVESYPNLKLLHSRYPTSKDLINNERESDDSYIIIIHCGSKGCENIQMEVHEVKKAFKNSFILAITPSEMRSYKGNNYADICIPNYYAAYELWRIIPKVINKLNIRNNYDFEFEDIKGTKHQIKMNDIVLIRSIFSMCYIVTSSQQKYLGKFSMDYFMYINRRKAVQFEEANPYCLVNTNHVWKVECKRLIAGNNKIRSTYSYSFIFRYEYIRNRFEYFYM